MWTIIAALSIAAASDPSIDVEQAAQAKVHAQWTKKAPRIARKVCAKHPDKTCRKTLEAQIRVLLTDPDAFEVQEELAVRAESAPRIQELLDYAYSGPGHEYLLVRHEACIARQSEAFRSEAPDLARVLCAGSQGEHCLEQQTEFITRFANEGLWDPDPFWNEIDAIDALSPTPEQSAVTKRMRNHLEQRCTE